MFRDFRCYEAVCYISMIRDDSTVDLFHVQTIIHAQKTTNKCEKTEQNTKPTIVDVIIIQMGNYYDCQCNGSKPILVTYFQNFLIKMFIKYYTASDIYIRSKFSTTQ